MLSGARSDPRMERRHPYVGVITLQMALIALGELHAARNSQLLLRTSTAEANTPACHPSRESGGTTSSALLTSLPTADERKLQSRWALPECAHLAGRATILRRPAPQAIPPPFHTWVFPWRMLMCACRASSSEMIAITAPVRLAHHGHVIKVGEQLLVIWKSSPDGFQSWVPSHREQHWHEGVALLPSLSLRDFLSIHRLILPQMRGWGPDEQPRKREDLISAFHPQEAFSNTAFLEIRSSCPNPVNGHKCGVDVLVTCTMCATHSHPVAFSAFFATC